jgi:hypothetical protein
MCVDQEKSFVFPSRAISCADNDAYLQIQAPRYCKGFNGNLDDLEISVVRGR